MRRSTPPWDAWDPLSLLEDRPQALDLLRGKFLVFDQLRDHGDQRAPRDAVGQRLQPPGRVRLAADLCRKELSPETAVTVDETLVLEPLQESLDGAVRRPRGVRLGLFAESARREAPLLPELLHDREFGVGQTRRRHLDPLLDRLRHGGVDPRTIIS